VSETTAPFAELSQFEVDPDAVQLLGYGYCAKKHVVVLGRVDPDGHDAVTVGMLRPGDAQLLTSLQSFLHRPILPVQLNAWEIQRALDIGYGTLDAAADPGRLVLPTDAAPSYEPGHPAPALAQELLARALGLHARQIHIERYADDVDVRLRVDGRLHQLGTPLSPDNVGAVVGYLAVLAGIPESETGPRQGIIRATLGDAAGGHPVDLRVALLPGPYGDDVTLHVMHPPSAPRPLSELGLSTTQLAALRARLDAGQGLVVIAGSVDQGRTTCLYSALADLDAERRKVLTVEPVMELDVAKVPQRTPAVGASLAALAAASLDHAPDVLALGAVDDAATTAVLATALRRGVLVIAVVDARDAAGAIATLRRLGLPDPELADHLVAVWSPRLLPRLCRACRTIVPDDPRAAALARAGTPVRGWTAPGCSTCGGRGHHGRIAVHELLLPTPQLRRDIATAASAPSIRSGATGEATIVEAALRLADAGEVDLATVASLPGAAERFAP
jgi:type II secretory ATPase GspE/PulE/Tfp pilus assembly ATPase PilB-like protein